MDNLVVAAIVVLVVIILYLVLAKNADSLFIDSVKIAKDSCATAVTSQTDTDFATAVANIAAAKTARSASLNQYVGGAPIPAEVSAASADLNSVMCGNHTLDVLAVDAVTTAKAASDAYVKAPNSDNFKTASDAYARATDAVTKALKQYPSGFTNYVTPALKVAIDTLKGIQLTAPAVVIPGATGVIDPANVTFNISGKSNADDHLDILVNGTRVFNDSNGNWRVPSMWTLNGIKFGDRIDFVVTNGSGPAGLIASWTTPTGTYTSNAATLSGAVDVPGLNGGEPAAVATVKSGHPASATWVWTDNSGNAANGAVGKFTWIAK